jgi:3-hydroxyisobutyrate dehydrogenase
MIQQVPSDAAAPRAIATIGFIGVGVMGEPMCAQLARRSGRSVLAHDLREEPLLRLQLYGVKKATPAEIAQSCDLLVLSLPDGPAVEAVLAEIEPLLKPGQCVVDTSTAPVALTRAIGARLAARGIGFSDAPVARTSEAASRGELSIMVGASDEVFAHIRLLLEILGSDITHCGPVGSGQLVKLLNNMLLFQNVAALAEAIAIARRHGLAPEALLGAVASSSGDSFALRHHGMKALLPASFPERAYPVRYAIKDLSYTLELAETAGLKVPGAELTMQRLRATEHPDSGEEYFPALMRVIDWP